MAKVGESSSERRIKTMESGILELQIWLEDVVRIGLVELSQRQGDYWSLKGKRMWDAKCKGLANLIYMLPQAFRRPNWKEEATDILAKLHLASTGFQNRDHLPDLLVEDLKTFIGVDQKKELARQQPAIADQWLVLGKKLGKADNVNSQTLWLKGRETGRFAQILEYKFGSDDFDTKLFPGQSIEASLHFHASNYPMRAILQEEHAPFCGYQNPVGVEAFEQLLRDYSEALGKNPFLYRYPALFDNIKPLISTDGNLFLVDQNQQIIPVWPRFASQLELMAISGGNAISLFGEWTGTQLIPLSVFEGEGWLSLA